MSVDINAAILDHPVATRRKAALWVEVQCQYH
jgi:hypothetical protein